MAHVRHFRAHFGRSQAIRRGVAALVVVLAVAGCVADQAEQQKAALTLSSDSLAQRQAQMRRFDTGDEAVVLSACLSVLQDLGFLLEESAASSGLVVGFKDRSTLDPRDVATFGSSWGAAQRIRISVVTKPSADRAATVVRVSIQRIIPIAPNQPPRTETVTDPALFQKFFDQLSQSVFLEAHEL